jgi:hypothetical protein
MCIKIIEEVIKDSPLKFNGKNHLEFETNQFRVFLFFDKDIFDMEFLENNEVRRGEIEINNVTYYYIIDKK